jgi:hypothetical protein
VIRHLTVIAWLNANSGAVTAIVTAVYAFFTILLWWATRRQAWLSNQLATAAGIQAEAAKAQADITGLSFEAANRPHIEIRAEENSFLFTTEHYSLRFVLENHGSVPAVLTGWRATVNLASGQHVVDRPHEPEDGGICIFPQRQVIVALQRGEGPEVPAPEARVDVTVEYRGLPNSSYRIRSRFFGRRMQWKTEFVEVT